MSPNRLRPRRGFTLIELLITLVMVSIVGAAIIGTFRSQQRVIRAMSDVGDVRTQLQTAAAVLPVDLRGISAVGGDILFMSDSAIEVRATVATSIVCQGVAGGTTVTMAPAGFIPSATSAAQNIRLTTVVLDPIPGDSLFIWSEGPTLAANDDIWTAAGGVPFIIRDTASAIGACTAPFGNNPALRAKILTLDGGTPLPANITRGAALRVTRRIRYGLYQAGDGNWYLGFRDGSVGSYQYVAGPFLPYAADPNPSGLRFTYYDTLNARVNDMTQLTNVGRIQMTFRAKSSRAVSLSGSSDGRVREDSINVSVAIRNR